MFLKHILEFVGITVKTPITVQVDNVGAIYMANNAVTQRTKHIDILYHVIREYIEDGAVKIIFVCTDENVADIFTKNTSQDTYNNHTDRFMDKTNLL